MSETMVSFITIMLAIKMTNAIIKEAVNSRTVLLLMVKLVGNKKKHC